MGQRVQAFTLPLFANHTSSDLKLWPFCTKDDCIRFSPRAFWVLFTPVDSSVMPRSARLFSSPAWTLASPLSCHTLTPCSSAPVSLPSPLVSYWAILL